VSAQEASGPDAPAADPIAAVKEALVRPGGWFEVQEKDVRGNRMPVFVHRWRSLREMLERTRRFGERTFIVEGDRRLTFEEHLDLVDAVAHALQSDHGVQPGDRVAIFAANRWEWLVCFWAATTVGAVPVALNSLWTPAELAYAVELTEPVLVFGDQARLARVDHAGLDVPVVDLDSHLPHVLAEHAGQRPQVWAPSEDDAAMLIFTSGTTGRPKAVTIPHRTVCGFAQVTMFNDNVARVLFGAPVPTSDTDLALSDDVVLITSPLFHVSMLTGVSMLAVANGFAVVLLPGRFDPEAVLRTIERERVTMWSALGGAAPRTASCPAVGRYDTSSIRVIGIGGATVSPSVQDALRRTFPSMLALGMGYTSTEAGATVAVIGGPEFAANPTSTGRISMTVEVELRGEDDTRVPEGEHGEVHVRSPYLMLGYWNDPQSSNAVLKDGGWLAMGDIARLEDGLLYINARARDMILVNAENVSPTEVEYVLEEHPAVAEAAVFAVDDDVTGDAVCAVLSLVPGATVTPGDLADRCRAKLARYKVPTRWFLRTDPLPRTPSGKLIKAQLRSWVETEAGPGG
jgi:acyl-CoA synthetase (AMP-forming)/AMP-acid ligase II